MGRKGARERAPFSPSGGNGSKRTLRSFVAPHRPSPSGLRGKRRRSEMDELSPPGGSEGYGACGMGPPQKPSEVGFAGKGAAAEWMSFRQGRKRRIWSLRSFGAPRRPSPSGLRGERRRNGMNELSPPGGSEGYGACGMGPPQKPSEVGFAGKGAAAEWMSFRQGRKRRIWSLRRRCHASRPPRRSPSLRLRADPVGLCPPWVLPIAPVQAPCSRAFSASHRTVPRWSSR